MPVIDLRDMSKRFGATLAVDHLTFAVESGTVMGFLGPNGAGKTTTLRALLGLVQPSAGKATINGRVYADLAEPLRQVGAVLEASSFHPGRSARNHLRVQAVMAGIPASRIADVLELVELTEAADRKVRTYSLGMRQRLGLAAAMLGDPEVLVLDEPANGLDPMGVRWLRDLLRRLAGEGRTVLVSSHILAEVAQTVDSVVIIDRGRLMMQASLEELNTSAGSVVRVRTPEAQRLGDALSRDGDGVRVTYLADDRLEIAGVTPQRVGALAAELRIPLHESTTEVATLEDVFLGLTASLDLEEVLQ